MRAAIAICGLMDRNPGLSLADLARSLPETWLTPTMSPACPDTEKHAVVSRVTERLHAMAKTGGTLAGRAIAGIIETDGARVMLDNGVWGLVRASSNTPNLVVICESPQSEGEMRSIFHDLDALLRREPSVGSYDQTI